MNFTNKEEEEEEEEEVGVAVEPYTFIDVIDMEKDESSNTLTNETMENSIMNVLIDTANEDYNNQTSCHTDINVDVDMDMDTDMDTLNEYNEIMVSFYYALEIWRLQNTTMESKNWTMNDQNLLLVYIMENVIHEWLVLELLHDCKSLRFLDEKTNALKNDTNTFLMVQSISSLPPDKIQRNKKCHEKKDQYQWDMENDCFVVQSTFSIVLDMTMTMTMTSDYHKKDEKEIQSHVLDVIHRGMTNEVLIRKANDQLLRMTSSERYDSMEIIKFTYYEDTNIWKLILGLCISIIALIILLLVCVMKRKHRYMKQYDEDDFHSQNNIANVLDGNDSYDFATNGIQSRSQSNDSDSISSYTGDAKHTLDVHICTSAYCLTCRKLGKPPTFLCVDVPNTPSIELTSSLPQDWWKKEEYSETNE